MNRQEAATIIKAISKDAIDAREIPVLDIVDAAVMAVEALISSDNPHIQTAPKPTSDTQTDNHNRQGCRYCDWIDITRAHEDEDGPLNYCRVCGRRLAQSG